MEECWTISRTALQWPAWDLCGAKAGLLWVWGWVFLSTDRGGGRPSCFVRSLAFTMNFCPRPTVQYAMFSVPYRRQTLRRFLRPEFDSRTGESYLTHSCAGTGSVLKTIRDKSRRDRSEQSRDDQGGWCPTIHHRTETEQRTTKRGRGYQHTGGKWQSLRDWVVPRQQHVFLSLEHS